MSTYTWTPDEGARGSAERGRELVQKYECNRCHDGTGHDPAPLDKHCVHCHQRIILKTYDAKPELLAKWERNLPHLREVPSLTAAGARLRRGWVEAFIKSPHDLRPGLTAEMPRLELTDADARDLATYLVPDDGAPYALDGASAERGRKLVETRACGGCHVLSGAPALPASPPSGEPRDRDKSVSLAPDLRHVQGKWKAGPLVAWLVDPKKVKPDAVMPATGLTEPEARDVALYLLTARLEPEAPYVPKARLPVLERAVTWAEVETKIFRRTCWHCHSDPDYAIGDGGPGNTGGFGFAGVGLNVATYQGILSGAFPSRRHQPDALARERVQATRRWHAAHRRRDVGAPRRARRQAAPRREGYAARPAALFDGRHPARRELDRPRAAPVVRSTSMLAVAHAPRESSRVDPSAGPGALVGGRYRLEQRLGAGAMGEVWLAEHVSLRSKVALKLVETAGRPNAAELCARFQHEAQAAARIESPFVVRVLDHGVDGTLAFLAMEVLRGESLDQRLLAQGKLSPEAVTLIVAQMALAIDAAHRMGVVHRDLKPANVLLVRATLGAEPGAPCEMAKVVDFGIAKTLGDDRDAALQTQAGVVLGTPVYMSPEQVTGDELDRRSDLWQLGVITYECLVGALPFQGTALGEIFMRICGAPLPVPSARAPSLPAAFDAWFARACARESRRAFSRLDRARAGARRGARHRARAGAGWRHPARRAPRAPTPHPPARRWWRVAVDALSPGNGRLARRRPRPRCAARGPRRLAVAKRGARGTSRLGRRLAQALERERSAARRRERRARRASSGHPAASRGHQRRDQLDQLDQLDQRDRHDQRRRAHHDGERPRHTERATTKRPCPTTAPWPALARGPARLLMPRSRA
jgi:cytochrome c2